MGHTGSGTAKAGAADGGAGAWRGRDLGIRTVRYTDRDAILYALAVGAGADRLDLVFEDGLRVLPGFALTLAQWAPDALGAAGAFDPRTAVHGAMRLDVHAPLPPSGEVAMSARVAEVWDKGSAAVFEVEVSSPFSTAVWTLFAPGRGGFGGDRGSGSAGAPPGGEHPARTAEVRIGPDQAALYRLLGDRHAMHIDPEAARAAGMPRPFLHGLCTVSTLALALADGTGAHPADLASLECRFAAPVFPGDTLSLAYSGPRSALSFSAARNAAPVITRASARFAG
ncbi:MaoC/PaaZ C-terminal domain-containing protein [Nocardiopsis coralliicola]